MKLAYEAVSYDSGVVEPGNPEGFALEHYDQTPSPLASPGGFTSSSPSFVDSKNVTNNAPEFLRVITEQLNSQLNTQQLASPGTPNVVTNLTTTSTQGVSGLQGIAFPISTAVSSASTIAATVRKLF